MVGPGHRGAGLAGRAGEAVVSCLILDQPKPVVVTQADGEFEGSLLAWQRPAHRGDPWQSLVQYHRGVGLQHYHWVTQGEVRPKHRSPAHGGSSDSGGPPPGQFNLEFRLWIRSGPPSASDHALDGLVVQPTRSVRSCRDGRVGDGRGERVHRGSAAAPARSRPRSRCTRARNRAPRAQTGASGRPSGTCSWSR